MQLIGEGEACVKALQLRNMLWNSLINISLAASSWLFFSVHSTAFNLKETSYAFCLDIALAKLCSFATVKCEIDSRQVTKQLSTNVSIERRSKRHRQALQKASYIDHCKLLFWTRLPLKVYPSDPWPLLEP